MAELLEIPCTEISRVYYFDDKKHEKYKKYLVTDTVGSYYVTRLETGYRIEFPAEYLLKQSIGIKKQIEDDKKQTLTEVES